MAWTLPAHSVQSTRKGSSGIAVWTLQRALNTVAGAGLAEDGAFGPATDAAVRAWQTQRGLFVDGIAGYDTQRHLVLVVNAVRDAQTALPRRLLDGFAQGEGGWLLAAVNHDVPGGTDCGVFERRVLEADYGNDVVVQRAFDAAYQAGLLAQSLVDRHGVFMGRAGTKDSTGGLVETEKAWRLAALNHLYPAGADTLSKTPVSDLTAYWTTPAQWVTDRDLTFPDGTPVKTPLERCAHYAGVLGRFHGSRGTVTAMVTAWL